jgi:hypothetical protein
MMENAQRVHSLGENKERKIARNSLSTVRPGTHDIIWVCTYLVVGEGEINMFRDLIEVRNARGRYQDKNGPNGTQ